MKKLLSTFMALSMLTSLPVCSVYAESNAELGRLASSLGADTDYLAVTNQFYDTGKNTECIIGYDYRGFTQAGGETISTVEGMGAYSDTSFGISVMEVLSHNGLISAGDIKEGANSLNEINQISDVKNMIIGYQNLFNKNEFQLYRNYIFQSTSSEEKIDILCNTAEKCMNEGEYFLIMYGSCCKTPSALDIEKVKGDLNMASTRARQEHSAVGMGITDGSWTFNGKTYDKCILTLDSFNSDENNGAFSEDTCIYINSETKDFYIPKISEYAESDMHIAVIDDNKLLNFEGPINPTDSFDTDISDIAFVQYSTKGNIRELSYTDKNGKEVVMNERDGYIKNYPNIPGRTIKSDLVRHHILSNNECDYMDIRNVNGFCEISFAGADSELYFDKNECYKFVRLEHAEDDTAHDENAPLEYSMIYNKDYKDRNFIFDFKGETMDEAEVKMLDDGVVFSGGNIEFNVYPKGSMNVEDLKSIAFSPSSEVFVQYNETDGFKIMADLNKDGNFEHQVEKGDVNCDGFIDSVDATAVLQAYAKLSVQDSRNPETVYADNMLSDFNGDGFIDSVDATLILQKYAELSAK